MLKRWMKIKKRLESDNPSQYKVAILEADKLADEILVYMAYKGANMTERLEEAKVEQLEDKEALIRAHKIRNQIIHQSDFPVDKELAEGTIAIYEKFLHHFEFI
jgi:glycerol dehydrogenase-like iron-containing ADH family enzyme